MFSAFTSGFSACCMKQKYKRNLKKDWQIIEVEVKTSKYRKNTAFTLKNVG